MGHGHFGQSGRGSIYATRIAYGVPLDQMEP
jgi:hypothetical protein